MNDHKMIQLPKWVLSSPFPSVYDTESMSSIQMVAKVYAAMGELIENYNYFITKIETTVNEFETMSEEEREVFAVDLRQEFQDFIDTVSLKVMSQDNKFNEADSYMRSEIQKIASMFIQQAINDQLDIYNGSMLSNLNMNNFLIHNLGNAAAAGDALSKGFAETLFAPIGYGLGKFPEQELTNADTAKKNGWYEIKSDTVNGVASNGILRTDFHSNNFGFQTAYVPGYNTFLMRMCTSGSYGVWAWLNAALEVGVEYPTTEMYEEKTVYVKLIETGDLTNGSYLNYSNEAVKPIRASVTADSGKYLLPYYGGGALHGGNWSIWYDVKEKKFIGYMGTSIAAMNYKACIWYVKN